MKRLTLTLCAASFILLSCRDNKTSTDNKMAGNETPKEQKTDAVDPPMDSAAMMKAWMAFMTPGDIHKTLAKYNGTWNEEITMWMDPKAPPTKNSATCVNKMILGGRYQESRHTGTFDKMPFEGISTLAYDNARKVYQSSWIDNMGTSISYLEGTMDDASKTLTLKGKMTDPMTGKEMEVKETMKFIDDNNQVLEMYDMRNGKENKTMEIKFTRKK